MSTIFKIIIIIALIVFLGPIVIKILGTVFNYLGKGCTWLGDILDFMGFNGLLFKGGK